MCVALSQALVVCALVAQPSLILCDPTDSSPPYSSVCGIPRQEYSSGLSFPSQGIFLTQGLNLHLLNGQVGSLPLSHLVSQVKYCILLKHYFSHYCKNKEWHFLKQNFSSDSKPVKKWRLVLGHCENVLKVHDLDIGMLKMNFSDHKNLMKYYSKCKILWT